MITNERKQELAALGYKIEDMGKEWGDKFAGRFRWLLTELPDLGHVSSLLDWGFPCDSEDEAWCAADAYQKESQEALQY